MNPPVEVLCDFDGTITKGDTTDVLLEALADPAWKVIEEQWERGEIGSRECMSRQIPLIRGGWKAIAKILEGVKVDPTFAALASWCRREGIPIRIVSDGIDKVITHLLHREGIKVDSIWANHLIEGHDGELSLKYPKAPGRNDCGAGVCKCQLLKHGSNNTFKIVVGDGRSDFCWAPYADMLFAKSKLLDHCRKNNVDCIAFEDFHLVSAVLEQKVAPVLQPAAMPVFTPALRAS